MVNIYQHFDSVSEFAEFVAKPRAWDAGNCDTLGRGTLDWEDYGSVDFSGAMALVANGWPEGRAKLVTALDGAKRLVAVQERAQAYDVAGFRPEVPRYLAGAPDCMVTFGTDNRATKPIVRIQAHRGARANIPNDNIMNWGVALLSHIDRLETEGYSVELTLCVMAKSGFNTATHSLIVKRAGEPLDLDRLAFVLINPAFHRRLGFAFREQFKELEPSFARGYGTTTDIKLEDREPGTLYIPHVTNEKLWDRLATALEAMAGLLAGVDASDLAA